MVAFKNSTGIKANSSFCTFRFPIAEAHQLTKPFQYQAITTALPTQPFAHFVFMPIVAQLFWNDIIDRRHKAVRKRRFVCQFGSCHSFSTVNLKPFSTAYMQRRRILQQNAPSFYL